MTAEAWASIAERFGLPVAGLVVILWSGALGWWLFRRSHESIVQGLREQIDLLKEQVRTITAACQAELAQERQERREEVEQMRRERDQMMAMAHEAWGRAEHALDVAGVPKPSPVRRRVGGAA